MRFSIHLKLKLMSERSYLTEQMCIDVVADPEHTAIQQDGTEAHWGAVVPFDTGRVYYLKVVTSQEQTNVVTAYLDHHFVRRYRRGEK